LGLSGSAAGRSRAGIFPLLDTKAARLLPLEASPFRLRLGDSAYRGQNVSKKINNLTTLYLIQKDK
jgi:hypothetical protein